jgi:hypothetical protein
MPRLGSHFGSEVEKTIEAIKILGSSESRHKHSQWCVHQGLYKNSQLLKTTFSKKTKNISRIYFCFIWQNLKDAGASMLAACRKNPPELSKHFYFSTLFTPPSWPPPASGTWRSLRPAWLWWASGLRQSWPKNKVCKVQRPFLNFPPRGKLWPRGEFCPLGMKLSPGDEIICSPLHSSKQ